MWMRTNVEKIKKCARRGVFQALAFAHSKWGCWNFDNPNEIEELTSIAVARILEISGHENRDIDGFLITAARYAAQSRIKTFCHRTAILNDVLLPYSGMMEEIA
jgi:hypothetical protein